MATIEFPKKGLQVQQCRREFISELLDEIPNAWLDTGFAVRLSVVTDLTTTFSIRIPSPGQSREEHIQISNSDLIEELVRESEVRGVVAALQAQLRAPHKPELPHGGAKTYEPDSRESEEDNVIQFPKRANAST